MALPSDICNVIEDKQRGTLIGPRLTPHREITFANMKVACKHLLTSSQV